MTVTAANFKARFPEFAAVSDELIDLVIAEQAPQVGDSWLERDRDPALRFLVAHNLALSGHLADTSDGQSLQDGQMALRLTSYKVGDTSATFSDGSGSGNGGGASAGSKAWYDLTSYGQQFWLYLRRNFTSIAVV